MQKVKGMVGNLVDESGSFPLLFKHQLTEDEKDAIVQAAYDWYASHAETVLAIRAGESGQLQRIDSKLKFDALLHTFDELVVPEISGIWRELLKK